MSDKIKVLCVDDSILFRSMLRRELSLSKEIEVIDTASNPLDAEEKIMRLNPDVVTLDVEMPVMNGIEFLKKFMPKKRVPVVVLTSSATRAFDAVSAGAVDFMKKPTVQSGEELKMFVNKLINTIIHASKANVSRAHVAPAQHVASATPLVLSRPVSSNSIIALGASTGGTDALIEVVKRLPANSPPVIIVQHMPAGFTRMYADRLDRLCAMSAKEAQDGDRLRQGQIIVGAGEYHLRLERDARGYFISSKHGEKVSGHCPSVDVMFESVARTAGSNAVGAILTGMGADGAEGLLKMRQAGAYTIGQDEASCVVYGMPAVAYKIGAVCKQLPLTMIAEEILSKVK